MRPSTQVALRIHDTNSGSTYFSQRRKRDDDGSPRELTFTCCRRFPFLARDRNREWLVAAIAQHRRDWPIDIWADEQVSKPSAGTR